MAEAPLVQSWTKYSPVEIKKCLPKEGIDLDGPIVLRVHFKNQINKDYPCLGLVLEVQGHTFTKAFAFYGADFVVEDLADQGVEPLKVLVIECPVVFEQLLDNDFYDQANSILGCRTI